MLYLICFLVTFAACIIGTICGMGGGIIIKPVLDAAGMMSVSTVTFLSGCTVIAMSCWNVGKTALKKEAALDISSTPFLAAGAAVGGIAGKKLFDMAAAFLEYPDKAGGVQACLLLIATFATLIYTVKKDNITPKQVSSRTVSVIIGLLLGLLGAFLGIGGGPFNVAVLCYFFSMPTKKATQNSLLIVLLSQLSSTLRTLLVSGVPMLDPIVLTGMIISAVAASEIGRQIHRRLDEHRATLCLEGAMLLIMGISVYNIFRFF